jgi:hypothetical protein
MEPIVIEDDETSTQMNNSSLIYKILFWIFLFAFVCSLIYIFLFSNIKDTEKLTTLKLQTLIGKNPEQYQKFVQRKRSEQSLADWNARQERKRSEQSFADWKARLRPQQQVDQSTYGQSLMSLG